MRIHRFLFAAFCVLMAAAAVRAADTTTAPASQIPPAEADAKSRLNSSPRHGEWVDLEVPGRKTPLKAYIVYPERKDKAPVVLVIQEIFGLTDWVRGVTDQLAADGFIAIAPDFLSGMGPNGGGTEAFASRDDVTRAVRNIKAEDVVAGLDAARSYGLKLPAASGKSASIGFCWGGGMSFIYATSQPELNAAVVYYGTPPHDSELPTIHAPIAGFYGGDDARVTSTVQPAVEKMKKLDKPYTPHVFDGAGHGFLRAQDQRNGANLKAAQQAWPATIDFLRKYTETAP
ncbi:MAG TPA: dienelactone hydrolase family protein [Phycisphaerae bacterium]|nr:dienelactone hydrolase family protein [Phycisphaerae bacterium]